MDELRNGGLGRDWCRQLGVVLASPTRPTDMGTLRFDFVSHISELIAGKQIRLTRLACFHQISTKNNPFSVLLPMQHAFFPT